MASYLLLYSHRSLQIRMESRTAHSYSLSPRQLLLFGMPAPAVLPAILMKSLLLAAGAGYVAHRSKHVSVLLLLAVVAFYQLTGTLENGL